MREIKIAFMGDVMPGGLLHYSKTSFIKDDVLKCLNSFDLRIATLECALGDDLEYYRQYLDKLGRDKNIIFAKNYDIKRLKTLNIDIVTIANNHIFDLGAKGLENTIKILKENNIKYCGAGENIEKASEPAVIELMGKDIAFIGCAEIIPSSPYPAGINQPGFNPLNVENIVNDIRKAKKKYDYVFVLPHWGIEYTYLPSLKNRNIAYRFINAGADGVFGGHSHTTQPHIFYKRKPILFSMGNFLFPDRLVQPPAPTYYPDNLDTIKNIPVSKSPRCNEITLKSWPPIARIGMIASVNLSDKITLNKKYTYLNMSNQIQFTELTSKVKILLKFLQAILKSVYKPFYKSIIIRRKVIQSLKKEK